MVLGVGEGKEYDRLRDTETRRNTSVEFVRKAISTETFGFRMTESHAC